MLGALVGKPAVQHAGFVCKHRCSCAISSFSARSRTLLQKRMAKEMVSMV